MAFYIVYNGFWNPDHPPESAAALIAAAAARGHELIATPNTAWVAAFDRDGVTVTGDGRRLGAGDVVLFWDKDTRLAFAMEAAGARLYNAAAAVEVCDDKLRTHRALAAAGVPMPRTLAAPMTYVHMDAAACGLFRRQAAALGFPLVVKECFGSLGGQVYLAKDAAALDALIDRMDARPFLVQRFVGESAGNDKRLYVVGDRVVAAMRRHSDTDFRANIEHGGVGAAYEPTAAEAALARRCCAVLGLSFAGVDLLDSADGTLVCEVNSNAHMAGLTACTGVDVADALVRFVLEKEWGE